MPEVVHFEPFHQELRRSVMVTTEIRGRPIGQDHRGVDVSRVLAAAGRDLAVIHEAGVVGFGWVRRDQPDTSLLAADLPTLRAFAIGDLEAHLAGLAEVLGVDEIGVFRHLVDRCDAWLDDAQSVLAHGDLDASHIFHADGEYTGIIDFGEIRGADWSYDLGHVALHDGEAIPYPMLPHLLAGYDEVVVLPLDHESRIWLWSVLIGVRALARQAARPGSSYRDHLIKSIRRTMVRLSG